MRMSILLFSLLMIPLLSTENIRLQTSSTDTHEYKSFCEDAAKDRELFAEFKRIPIYTGVLEHVSFGQGWSYFNILYKQTPQLLDKIEKFIENDSIGHPTTYYYPQIKREISPTTLRYIKVASDLLLLFGEELSQFSIVEIGGGYGGQCKILSDLFPLKSYTIVDLPSVIELARRYLGELGVEGVTFATHQDSIINKEFDLVISNYAFSECTDKMQQKYVDEILSHSKRGYITCNVGAATKEALLKRLSDAHIQWREYPENPLTAIDNYLLVWKEGEK